MDLVFSRYIFEQLISEYISLIDIALLWLYSIIRIYRIYI